MSFIAFPFRDGLFRTGIILIVISLLLFSLPLVLPTASESHMPFFFIHYALAAGYFFSVGLRRLIRKSTYQRQHIFLLLTLFLISAYALNREMAVFDASPIWFSVLLTVLCATYIATVYFERLPRWVQHSVLFLTGIGAVVFLYLAIYLLPLYLFSGVAMLALGISVHTFVPLLFFIQTFLLIRGLAKTHSRRWIPFGTGVAASVATVVAYSIAWQAQVQTINTAYNAALSEGGNELPAWMKTAQQIDHNSITEKVLKTDLVYLTPQWDGDIFWNLPSRRFGETQPIHDPLVVLATFFTQHLPLTDDDKINILKSLYGGRHQTEVRLWNGKDLRTQNILSTIQLWPENRLAYTEKIITVHNGQSNRWGERQEEAIYTFHLPEGGVATSLSLWVNGREEKAILTTKEKADTAYRTVVGVERRDPSVMHWREGNHVAVRVFPVLSNDKRIFKIGITAPLRRCGNQLLYESIPFDGPDASAATETIKLNLPKTAATGLQLASLSSNDGSTYTRTGRYDPKWHLTLPDAGLAPNVFHFNSYNYFFKPYMPQPVPVQITDVYLDINKAWTTADFEAAWQAAKAKPVWVYDGDLVRLTGANRYGLFKKLAAQRFSLFPVFKISHPQTALLVSKSDAATPNLSDLEGTPFLKGLKAFGQQGKKLKLFHIGDRLTPYLASLKEFRFFVYEHGDLKKLGERLQAGVFAADVETENEVVVHSAGVSIVRQQGVAVSSAPDHLMRLFAYNHILQQAGQRGLSAFPENSALVQTAKEAYVVSPVSSLVVLESQADYDRFNIHDSEASLKNASAQSKGAVPEPHEWMLIVIGAAVALYLFFKTRL